MLFWFSTKQRVFGTLTNTIFMLASNVKKPQQKYVNLFVIQDLVPIKF